MDWAAVSGIASDFLCSCSKRYDVDRRLPTHFHLYRSLFRIHIATNNGIEFTSQVKCDKTRVFCNPSSKSNTVYGELANSYTDDTIIFNHTMF